MASLHLSPVVSAIILFLLILSIYFLCFLLIFVFKKNVRPKGLGIGDLYIFLVFSGFAGTIIDLALAKSDYILESPKEIATFTLLGIVTTAYYSITRLLQVFKSNLFRI